MSVPRLLASEPTVREKSDVQLALLKYSGSFNTRLDGLKRLAWEIHKRTSIAMSTDIAVVTSETDAMFNFPLLILQGTSALPNFSQPAMDKLASYLRRGGSLLVDVSEGGADSAFDQSARKLLKQILPDTNIQKVSPDHVLYKSFYLVDRHGGRVPSRASLDGMFLENRLAVIFSSNDLAGALARNDYGDWTYDVGPGGDMTREVTFRLGINIIMYVLCLDYKEDQVHIPFILQRRK